LHIAVQCNGYRSVPLPLATGIVKVTGWTGWGGGGGSEMSIGDRMETMGQGGVGVNRCTLLCSVTAIFLSDIYQYRLVEVPMTGWTRWGRVAVGAVQWVTIALPVPTVKVISDRIETTG